MGLKEYVKVWDDVFDKGLDEALAPNLYEVYMGKTYAIYCDAGEFFKRTYISDSMYRILRDVSDVLNGRGGRNIYPLLSLFGGGKTHTLITIYHAIRSPEALATFYKDLASRFLELKGKVRLIVLDCESESLVPSPLRPLKVGNYEVKTIWGALAHHLGRYDDLRVEDEKIIPPTTERLKLLIGDKPIVILIDEIVKHTSGFLRASELFMRDYGKNIITFIENLAKAVSNTKSVLVIALPVEIREEQGVQLQLFEEAYKDVASSFFRAIGRITSTYEVPLTVNDVVEVLKRRLFEKIDKNVAQNIQNDYLSIYDSEIAVFGKESIVEGSNIAKNYPYHPSYINILYDIVTRNPDLQKTRHALTITRKVVRNIWSSKEDYDLIMPWHIDVSIEEIRNIIVTPTFRSFDAVVNRDLLGKVKSLSEPRIGYLIGLAIFLKTYVYGLAIKPQRMFPNKEGIAYITYEKSIFNRLNKRAAEIYDIVDVLRSNTYYLQEEDGRYWFTPIPSVIEIVEQESKNISDHEALEVLKEKVRGLLTKSPEQITKPRKTLEKPLTSLYDLTITRILEEPEPIDIDKDSYMLLVCLSELTEDDILKILYYDKSGRMRTHKNTITVIYPERSHDILDLKNLAKIFIACDKVGKELDKFYPDESIREIQRKKLNEYRDNYVYSSLLDRILNSLNIIAYPTFNVEKNREWYNLTRTKAAKMSIVGLVEDTLTEKGIGKIAKDINFEGLNFMLNSRLGIDIVNGDNEISLSNLIGYFYTNPRLPFIYPDVIKSCIEEGVKNLSIGLRRGGRIYYKRVYGKDEETPLSDIGEAPERIEDADLIVPWKIAIRSQVEKLLEDDGKIVRELKLKKRIWYVVKWEEEEVPLREVVKYRDYEDIIKAGIIIRKEEVIVEDVDVVLSNDVIVSYPNEIVQVEVKVMPIGEFTGKVILDVSDGSLKDKGGDIPFTTTWIIQTPLNPGRYDYKVTAFIEEINKRISKTLTVSVREKEKIVFVEGSDLEKYIGYELKRIEVSDLSEFNDIIRVIGKKLVVSKGSSSIKTRESNITLMFTNVDPEVARQLIRDSRDYLGGITQTEVLDFNVELSVIDSIKIEKGLVSEFKNFTKTKFYLKTL